MAAYHLSRVVPRAWRACTAVAKQGVVRRWCSTTPGSGTGGTGGSAAQGTLRTATESTAPGRHAVKPRRRRVRTAALAVGGLMATGAGGMAVWAQFDEGIERTLKFWGIGEWACVQLVIRRANPPRARRCLPTS